MSRKVYLELPGGDYLGLVIGNRGANRLVGVVHIACLRTVCRMRSYCVLKYHMVAVKQTNILQGSMQFHHTSILKHK